MQQRLGLGVALLGEPELILLDEPTSALDPIGRTDVRGIVRAARDRGATVILNSHLLTEVERVCDRVVILHHGRMIASGPLDDVVAVDGVRLHVTDLDEGGRAAVAAFGPVTVDDDWLTIRPLDGARIPDLVAAIVAAGGRVHAVEPGRGSLEARFLELITGIATARMIVIARLTVQELVRRRVVWVLVGLTIVSVALVALGLSRLVDLARQDGVEELEIRIGVSQILILIAFMFSFVLAMTAAFVGAPAVGGDLESGVALALLARPLRRADLLLGRWLGSAVVVVLYAIASGLLAIARRRGRVRIRAARALRGCGVPGGRGAGAAHPDPGARVGPAVDRRWCHRGRRLRARWMAGVLAGVASALGVDALRSVAEVSRWLLPTDGLWRGVIFGLEPPLVVMIAAGRAGRLAEANPFYATEPPPLAFIVWSVLWVALVLGAADMVVRASRPLSRGGSRAGVTPARRSAASVMRHRRGDPDGNPN